ncbi:MAG: methyltransferase domain-containing protein [Caldilineaceae bacterium]
MSTIPLSDSWEIGHPYEQYIGRWSRQIAPKFLSWLNIPVGRRWVDIGCGTGALAAAILDHCSPRSVTGIEPSQGFLKLADHHLSDRAQLFSGNAAAIPLENGSCDVVVSGLVLNFVPDIAAALTEMIRVSAPGGVVSAYVWDYAEGMEVIKTFWDEAVTLDPSATQLHEGIRFPLCIPTELSAAFTSAGLYDVAVTPLDLTAKFADFDDYWQPFLGGQGPAPAYVMSLPEGQREALRIKLQQKLQPATDGSITLGARAWGVRGVTL